MSNEEFPDQHGRQGHSEGPDPRYGGWEPTPQGDGFDADATAFVHLPPEDLANIPLAAPGQGYVPPMILPLTPAAGLDPAATGSWVLQTQTQQAQAEQRAQEAAAQESSAQESGAVHWPDPNQQGGQGGYQGPYQDTSHATAQWNFTEAFGGMPAPETAAAPEGGHPGHANHSGDANDSGHVNHSGHANASGHTGQWTIPVADGDLPDESGEFLASAQTPQWYADSARPATLPGGAPAPWATPEPEPVADPVPVAEQTPEAEPAQDERAQDERAQDEPALDEPAEPTAQAVDAEPATTADIGGPAADEPEAAPAPEAEADPAPDEAPEAAHETPPDTAPEGAPQAAPETAPDGAPDATPEAAPDAGALPAAAPVPALLDAPSEHPSASYLLHVNGVDRPVSDAWIGESLLYVLRERLGLAGAKDGCSQGECGACNVQVDGRLVASCLVPAATAAGSEVRTVEGLAVDGEPSDVQRALSACGAVQCGFCIPGMAMTVHDLLEGNHAPSELETRQALCGNLCRCSGYRGVLDAVADVVAARETSAEAATVAHGEARIPHQAEPGAGGMQQGPHPHEGEAL
ncbi:2Fe-2S iron-sulfur cluster-binding protein [Streptomyces sp. CA-278952]|uniref:(2Fe-2S)-binding protein n=1 Tax=Streptomyces sp. CA-278952 TaxID=2980556 RepID=UPI002368A52D|nr:2Fe-2S iron-sulfur cluster-binding protein [Streptomyces sp. CA-278952]WDG30968.1 2Fe-2S iron-sulfur cluster-binding protein [Streptomyces sp. CA-278952]